MKKMIPMEELLMYMLTLHHKTHYPQPYQQRCNNDIYVEGYKDGLKRVLEDIRSFTAIEKNQINVINANEKVIELESITFDKLNNMSMEELLNRIESLEAKVNKK